MKFRRAWKGERQQSMGEMVGKDTKIRIGLDAGRDLREAGFSPTDAAITTFENSWARALRRAARVEGLRNVDWYRTTYGDVSDNDTKTDLDGDKTVEQVLWQTAHNGADIPMRGLRSRR